MRISSRLVAGLAAATLFLTAQAGDRLQREASADTVYAAAPAATLAALHSIPSHRFTTESRSTARWMSGLDAALPADVHTALAHAVERDDLTARDVFDASSVAVRGYDATAPPALS